MKKKTSIIIVWIVLAFLSATYSFGQNLNQIGSISDNWTATDGLNRKLVSEAETGFSRKNKYVGMFYWTWHTDALAAFSPVMNISEILNKYPEAATDANHQAWQGIPQGGVFWWDEPLFGYYRSTDEWVLRKHAEMLADAGVDVVFFDCTNGTFTWKSSYSVLLKVWNEARNDGVKTPQIAFLLPFGANPNSLTQMHEVYTDLYKPQLYQDLWFMWNGKPLIMAYPESLVVDENAGNAGLKFNAKSQFYAINATCPSWDNNIGNLTFSLYKWNSSYSQSVAGTPIAQKTFINFKDNEKIRLTFTQQEAGDYLWVLSNGTEQVGVWKWTDSKDAVVSYYRGVPVSGNYESEISYNLQYNFTPLTSGTVHTPIAIESSVDQQTVNEIKSFFTFRPGQPDYVNGPSRNDQWGWLENYPQHGYAPKTDGGFEQATVGVAQNASDASGGHASGFNTPLTYGRSYTKAFGQDARPDAYLKGLNFKEQWDGANALNPDFIFVTGFNEWTAGRWFDWDVKPFAFVDEYSAEKSRDIEPVKSWGNKGDVYYMQLIDNVRKFKGMRAPDTVSDSKTIEMENLSSWADVKPEYLSYKGNVMHRNHPGQGSTLVYSNTSGRNDIVSAKVARDASYIYFNVQTADVLTSKTDPKWMRLFIDIDRNKSTGWEGYDFIINRSEPGDSATIEKSLNSWNWTVAGSAAYVIDGKSLVLKIKRTLLGIEGDKVINLEFKWSDNMQEEGNIMDFYANGDVAPGGRFNYVYNVVWSDEKFRFAETPENINYGLKCNLYDGIFDTIPSFFNQKISKTEYPETFIIPETSAKNFGLKYSGYIEVPTKETYSFLLNAGLSAKLYIGSTLVVESGKDIGPQTGTIKLMPGKHSVTLEYITKEPFPNLLDVQMKNSSSLIYSPIPSSMLFKHNESPSALLVLNRTQKYYSPVDSVIHVKAADPDGSISKVAVYDNGQLINEVNTENFIVKNLPEGSHSIEVKAFDNDGSMTESNVLSFVVKSPTQIPGRINVEDYMNGSNITIVPSTDTDGGSSIKAAYGWVDYAVNVPESGIYHFTFRVPAATGTKNVTIKSDFIDIGTVNIGNTGTTQAWYNVTKDIQLKSGIQTLRFNFSGLVTIHRIDIYPYTSLNDASAMKVRVSPNPSSGDFLVQTSDNNANIIIYDMLGKVVAESESDKSNFERRIGSDLHPGIYLLVVTSTNGTKQRIRIIKK